MQQFVNIKAELCATVNGFSVNFSSLCCLFPEYQNI
jgi:hypothetical protein